MQLPKEFFHLQLQFAKRIAHILHIPPADALIEYSTLYMSFEFGRSFDPIHPMWQEYLAGLKSASDDVEWTYAFYLHHYTESYQENLFGCFYYAYNRDTKTVRLHFAHQDASGYSPLSRDRMETRLQELTELFIDVLTMHPEAGMVRGGSWLYNTEAYRRLFPPEYTQNAEVAIDGEFPFMALWGQFLNHHEQLRESMAQHFLNCVAEQETLASIKHCFPYLPLAPQCSIHHFYRFYKIN